MLLGVARFVSVLLPDAELSRVGVGWGGSAVVYRHVSTSKDSKSSVSDCASMGRLGEYLVGLLVWTFCG